MSSKHIRFEIKPEPKPRMTVRDKWAKRAPVLRYWAYCDKLRLLAKQKKFTMPDSNYWLTFHLPMPESWSEKRKLSMIGQPHQQKPDKDNLEKGFLDALCEKDQTIWDGRVSKYWAREGFITITFEE